MAHTSVDRFNTSRAPMAKPTCQAVQQHLHGLDESPTVQTMQQIWIRCDSEDVNAPAQHGSRLMPQIVLFSGQNKTKSSNTKSA